MFDMGNPYVRFLVSQKKQSFHIKPYVGNSGDCLIRMGTVRLLSDLGIRTTVNPKKADVILWPGGNPTMWRANIEGWKDVWSRFPKKEFVIGPATFQFGTIDWAGEIRQSQSRITGLFARDPDSFENLQKAQLPDGIQIGLSHDPAIYLRGSTWLGEHREAATEEYVLAAFRNDHEAAKKTRGYMRFCRHLLPGRIVRRLDRAIKVNNIERKIAMARERSTMTEPLRVCDASLLDFESFVETVRRAKEVHTDRLHCLLLAVMLGKQVFAYPTSYGKLEGVYEHSLKTWADVTFSSIK